MLPIAAIENAIIKQITAAKLPYLRFIGSYGGELMGDWQEVIRALPAVWVAFKDASAQECKNTARTRYQARLTYTTIVADRSASSEAATRKGGPGSGSIGTYQMLDDVARLICMQDFGLDNVDMLLPGRVRSLFDGKVQQQGLSVMSQEWTAKVQFRLREPGQGPLPADGAALPTGYLPPEGQTFPGTTNANNPAPLPELSKLALQYWLKPPQEMATDPPAAEDILPLNIQV